MTIDSMPSAPATLDDVNSLFGNYTAEAAKADEAEAAASGTGVRNVQVSKLDPGGYAYRFLPPKPGRKTMFSVRYTHFVKGGTKTRAVPCARRMSNLPCAICAEIERLNATGQKLDKDVADAMNPEFSVQALALDIDLPFDEAKPLAQLVCLEFKKSIHTDLIGIRNNVRTGGEFSHPISGFPVEITKKGAGMNTEYTVTPLRDQKGMIAPSIEQVAIILRDAPDIFSQKTMTDEEVATVLKEAGLGFAAPPAGAGGRGSVGSFVEGNFGGGARR